MKNETAILKIGNRKIKLKNTPTLSYTPTEIDNGDGTFSSGLGVWDPTVLEVDKEHNELVRRSLYEEREFILEEPNGKEMLVNHGSVISYDDEKITVAVKWAKLMYSEILYDV